LPAHGHQQAFEARLGDDSFRQRGPQEGAARTIELVRLQDPGGNLPPIVRVAEAQEFPDRVHLHDLVEGDIGKEITIGGVVIECGDQALGIQYDAARQTASMEQPRQALRGGPMGAIEA